MLRIKDRTSQLVSELFCYTDPTVAARSHAVFSEVFTRSTQIKVEVSTA